MIEMVVSDAEHQKEGNQYVKHLNELGNSNTESNTYEKLAFSKTKSSSSNIKNESPLYDDVKTNENEDVYLDVVPWLTIERTQKH